MREAPSSMTRCRQFRSPGSSVSEVQRNEVDQPGYYIRKLDGLESHIFALERHTYVRSDDSRSIETVQEVFE